MDSTARHWMWSRLIGGDYDTLTPRAKKSARNRFAADVDCKPGDYEPTQEDYNLDSIVITDKAINHCKEGCTFRICTPNTASISGAALKQGVKASPWAVSNSQMMDLVCTSSTASGLRKVPCKQAKEEKETTMAYDNDLEVSQRNHLKRRLDSVFSKASADVEQKYLPMVEQPTTKDEILRKLTAGEYKMRDEAFTKSGDLRDWFSSRESIEWIDPSKPRDQAGYESAYEALTKAYVAAKDTAIVGTLPEGLKALQDFEAMTF